MSMNALNLTFSAPCLASQKAGGQQARTSRAPRVIRCQAENADRSATLSTRRAMLASVGGIAVSLYAAPSKAVKEYITVCDPSEDGADCRRDQLAKDNQGLGLDYSKVSAPKETKISSTAVRSSDGFDKATRDLIVKVRAYNELTPFDKERPRLADELKTESNAWVAKYSPGGSCSYESGRDFYSALSALLGHLAFNGLAPMRGTMLASIERNCAATLVLLDKGR